MSKPPRRKLRIPTELAKRIRTFHPFLRRKVRAALDELLRDPHAGKTLRNELEGLRSFRFGKFRAIYRIGRGKVIHLIAVGPRKTIYAETLRKLRQEQ